MDHEVKASRPKWITNALSTAVRTECYETATGIAEYALAIFSQFSTAERTKALPWIVDALVATGKLSRARHLLLSNISLISESDALFSQFSTICLDADEIDPAWALLPSGKLNAFYLAQARFAADPRVLSIVARAGPQLRDNPQNNLLIYNHLSAVGRWGEARMFLNKALTPYAVPQVTSMDGRAAPPLASIAFKPQRTKSSGPLVSIIVSAFNAQDTVEYAIRSLLGQSYENIEILVCDDSSDDSTLVRVREHANVDGRVRLFRSERQQGPYNIRNALIRQAKGELITFHDADDVSVPTRIESQVDDLLSQPARVATVCRMIRFDSKGRTVFFKDHFALRTCVVSLMCRRAIFEACGPYRNTRFGADTEFYERLRMSFGEEAVFRAKSPLVLMLWSDASLTRAAGSECTEDGLRSAARRLYAEVAFRERLTTRMGDPSVQRQLGESGILIDPAEVHEITSQTPVGAR